MTLYKKVKWFLAISCVFLLILATNLIDKNNFLQVEKSVENIYNERLLAKELLLDISIKFHEKELAYATKDTSYLRTRSTAANEEISKALEVFDRAGASRNQKAILRKLNKNHEKLIRLEQNTTMEGKSYKDEFAQIFANINTGIVEMSNEQIREGRYQKFNARKAVEMVKLFSKIEIYILIFLALVLQFIVLYNPKKKLESSE